jgi:protein-tyrosine-phosphatase/DNA-binding transcriptional ArsR family regulator
MNIEERAAVHHALGDPSRLAVVDALAFGEASPTELQALLAMPSNLLAHHVRVLEQAGIVRRTRSEGDRRRTYLGLVAGALDTLLPAATREAPRVVFVCTQNSARSQLAAALWNAGSPVPATSAGTDPAPAVHPGAVSAARRHHLPMQATTPQRVADVLRPDDLVITVCDRAHEELDVAATHWSVTDPARAGDETAFDHALTDLAGRISRLAPAVRPTGTRSA